LRGGASPYTQVVLDLAACIRYCKEKLGYRKIVLAGWSGGGALSALYQSQAEVRSGTRTCTMRQALTPS